MTLDALRCFCAVVELGSFRGAAERVFRSQPAVSQQIKKLEQETGNLLIERATCRPTPMGVLLYERAHSILLEIETLGREVVDFDESVGQELRVGTSDTTALYTLPALVHEFSETFPQTRLVLINRNSSAIIRQVIKGDLDLGIITLTEPQSELDQQPLFQQRFVLVVPAAHPLAKLETVTLQDLSEESFLLIEEETRTGAMLHNWFEETNFTPQISLDSGSFEVIKRYIAEGMGVSFLPENVITPNDAALAVVEVEALPEVTIGAIRRKGAYQSKPARAFLNMLEESDTLNFKKSHSL